MTQIHCQVASCCLHLFRERVSAAFFISRERKSPLIELYWYKGNTHCIFTAQRQALTSEPQLVVERGVVLPEWAPAGQATRNLRIRLWTDDRQWQQFGCVSANICEHYTGRV